MNCLKQYTGKTILAVIALLTIGVTVNAQGVFDNLGLYAIGGSLGHISPAENVNMANPGSAIGIQLHADIGNITPEIVIFPNIGYWKKGYPSGESVGETSIGCDAHYYLDPEANTNFYLGAGLGIHMFSYSYEYASVGESSLGIRILGGVETPVGENYRLLGELVYKTDSNVNTLAVRGGITFELGN